MKLSGGRVHTYTTVMLQGVCVCCKKDMNVPGLDFFTVHDIFQTTGLVLKIEKKYVCNICKFCFNLDLSLFCVCYIING